MSQPAAHDGPPGQSRAVLVAGASGGIGKPGRYPATVADPVFQDRAVAIARDLARDAATAAGHRRRP